MNTRHAYHTTRRFSILLYQLEGNQILLSRCVVLWRMFLEQEASNTTPHHIIAHAHTEGNNCTAWAEKESKNCECESGIKQRKSAMEDGSGVSVA